MSSLTFTLIQTQLYWEDKKANLAMLEDKIKSITERTEVVVLPEMFSTGFSMKPEQLAETMEGETIQWMKRVAAQQKIILTGSVIIEDGQTEAGEQLSVAGQTGTVRPRYFNRLIWMLPNGQYGVYDKRHRFAYAGGDEQYTAGNKRLIASVKGWKINLQVCYDLRFPVWSRNTITEPASTSQPGLPEYDVLIFVANWPERRNHAWKTLLCARAIENQCYVVGVNRIGRDGNNINHSGNSLVIDPLGEVLYHHADEEDIFTIALEKERLDEVRTKFPFWKDGDSFIINR